MKKPNVRLGFDDLVLTAEENDNFNGWATIYDEDGKVIGEISCFVVAYEDEDGNEVDANGNEL
jgi:hypothetical protein